MNMARLKVTVSTDTDQSLRMFLASQGGVKKGDLSRIIEEAVPAHILVLSSKQAKTTNNNVSEADITSMIDEALKWARKRCCGLFWTKNDAGRTRRSVENIQTCSAVSARGLLLRRYVATGNEAPWTTG